MTGMRHFSCAGFQLVVCQITADFCVLSDLSLIILLMISISVEIDIINKIISERSERSLYKRFLLYKTLVCRITCLMVIGMFYLTCLI